MENETQYEEIQKVAKVERTDSYFDGKVLELIGYRILAFLITTFTLGLASAWAEKILLAYNIEHTVYNGKRLKFEGTGAALFVQKFKWIFFTIITLGIYSFWIPIKKEKWVVSNIHFEDEKFEKDESFFDGTVLGIIGVNLFCRIITVLSFGILYPFGICYKQKWIAKHTIINRKKIVFDGTALSLIGHYLLWLLLCIVTFGIYGFWLPIKIENWKAKNTHLKLKNEQEPKTSPIPGIIAAIVAIILIIVGITMFSQNIDKLKTNEKFDMEEMLEELNHKFKEGKNSASKGYYISPLMQDENTSNNNNSKPSQKEENSKKYSTNDYKRNKSLTLIDHVLCYGAVSHDLDMIATIESNGDISISEAMGAVLIENANAKYLYKVEKLAADVVDLYFITNNNELFVVRNENLKDAYPSKERVTNSEVVEFLGTELKDDGEYIKVLLADGSTEDILYIQY